MKKRGVKKGSRAAGVSSSTDIYICLKCVVSSHDDGFRVHGFCVLQIQMSTHHKRLVQCMNKLENMESRDSGALELRKILPSLSSSSSSHVLFISILSELTSSVLSRWIVDPSRRSASLCALLGSVLRYLNKGGEGVQSDLEIGMLSLFVVACEGTSGRVRASALDALSDAMSLSRGMNPLSGAQWLQMLRKDPIEAIKETKTQLKLRTQGALALALEDEESSVRIAALKCSSAAVMSTVNLEISRHALLARRFVRLVTEMLTDIACYDSDDSVRVEALREYSKLLRSPSLVVCCGLSIDQVSRMLKLLDDASISVRKAFVNLVRNSQFEHVDALSELLGGSLEWLGRQKMIFSTSTELSICLYMVDAVIKCAIRNKDYMHQRAIRNRVSEHLVNVLDKPDLVVKTVRSVGTMAKLASVLGLDVDKMGYLPMSQTRTLLPCLEFLDVATAALVFLCVCNAKPILMDTLRADMRRMLIHVTQHINIQKQDTSSIELCKYGPREISFPLRPNSAYWIAKPSTGIDRLASPFESFDIHVDMLLYKVVSKQQMCLRLRVVPEDASNLELVPEMTHYALLEQQQQKKRVGNNCVRVSGPVHFPCLATMGLMSKSKHLRLFMFLSVCPLNIERRSLTEELRFEMKLFIKTHSYS